MKLLDEVNETYWQHAGFALWGAWQCLICAVVLTIHALVPQVFTRSASTRLAATLSKMLERYSAGLCVGCNTMIKVDPLTGTTCECERRPIDPNRSKRKSVVTEIEQVLQWGDDSGYHRYVVRGGPVSVGQDEELVIDHVHDDDTIDVSVRKRK